MIVTGLAVSFDRLCKISLVSVGIK